MVKITLYNIGEPKEVVVFIIIFYTSFVLTICIPNIKRVSRRHIFGKKNTSASMLRYPTGTGTNAYHSATCNAIRFPTQHLHYI